MRRFSYLVVTLRLRKSHSTIVLLILGCSFALANLWFCAARSTIPLELNGQVTRKNRLVEKAIGVDDVCLITVNGDNSIQVDAGVFEAVTEGATLKKIRWSRKLAINETIVPIEWSQDFWGMAWTMPFAVLLFLVLSIPLISSRWNSPANKRMHRNAVSGRVSN